jgi:hypothetical protein
MPTGKAPIDHLMVGERTLEVSRRFGFSPARVSQLRREFRDDWSRFWADCDEVGTAPVSI